MTFEPFYAFDTTLGNALIDPAVDSRWIQSIAFRISSHVSALSFCSLFYAVVGCLRPASLETRDKIKQ